jgi:hypothetical protein
VPQISAHILKANGRNACHLLSYAEAALHREVTLRVPYDLNIQHCLFVYVYLFIFRLLDDVVRPNSAEWLDGNKQRTGTAEELSGLG